MAKKNEVKDVAVKEEAGALAMLNELEQDAGAGFEDMGMQDVAVPFLMILQSGSPQLKMGEQKIEGANEGDIYNSVTQEIFKGKEGVHVIPCFYKKSFVEWRPRESGGGFVTAYDDDAILAQTTKNAKGQDQLANGNIIVTTAYYYVLLVNVATGGSYRAVISMSSTQLKKSRRWNSLMQSIKVPGKTGVLFTPPMFSHIYHLTTVPEKNEKGAWAGWQIENAGLIPNSRASLYADAKAYGSEARQGLVKEATPVEEPPMDDNPSFM
jgi:hypothetical protein